MIRIAGLLGPVYMEVGDPQVGEVTRLAVVENLHTNLQPRGPGVTLLDVVTWSLDM